MKFESSTMYICHIKTITAYLRVNLVGNKRLNLHNQPCFTSTDLKPFLQSVGFFTTILRNLFLFTKERVNQLVDFSWKRVIISHLDFIFCHASSPKERQSRLFHKTILNCSANLNKCISDNVVFIDLVIFTTQ